jgi:hypothetical protein
MKSNLCVGLIESPQIMANRYAVAATVYAL